MDKKPVLRVFVGPSGVQRIDAAVTSERERQEAFALCNRVFDALQRLDSEVRATTASEFGEGRP